jgi:hypothetical protein
MVFFMQFPFKKIIVRVLFLLVPVAVLVIWHELTFDPHRLCIGDDHRHVDGFLGIALLSLFWFYLWLAFILFEIVYMLLKKYFKVKA